MISCETFRAKLQPDSRDAEVLEHLRKCDTCLDYAVAIDPDTFFRAIGGEELEPPGGVDAFTSDVMAQVRLRQAEGSVARRFLIAPRRLAAAAAIVVAVGAFLVYENNQHVGPALSRSAPAESRRYVLVTKPVVETYQSQNATIVEVPSENVNDAKVVMIFDDSLPADL
jgi:hypothetical protein